MENPQLRTQVLSEIDSRQDSLLESLEQLNHRVEGLIKAALSEFATRDSEQESAAA